jgi:hypothetical protein
VREDSLRADGFATIRVSNLPGWTWILLLFGFWPFLIAWYFATRRIDDREPRLIGGVDDL